MKKDALSSALDSPCLVLQNVSGGMNMKTVLMILLMVVVYSVVSVFSRIPLRSLVLGLLSNGTLSSVDTGAMIITVVSYALGILCAVVVFLLFRRSARKKEEDR